MRVPPPLLAAKASPRLGHTPESPDRNLLGRESRRGRPRPTQPSAPPHAKHSLPISFLWRRSPDRAPPASSARFQEKFPTPPTPPSPVPLPSRADFVEQSPELAP